MYTKDLEKSIHQNGFFNQSIEFSRLVFANFIDDTLRNKYPINNIFVLSGESGQGKTHFLKGLKSTFEENSGVIYLLNHDHSDIDIQEVQKSDMVFIDNIEYLLNESSVFTVGVLEKIKSVAENNDDTPFIICVRDHENKVFRSVFHDFTVIDFNTIDFKDVYDILSVYLNNLTPEELYNISDLIFHKVYRRIDLVKYIRYMMREQYEHHILENTDIIQVDFQILINKTKKYDFGN